ncbi:MAG: flagellar M-ring protein FliF [Clostridia bacterium]|nr:flagellar M-ring protein FliF [Clostridia bacterium]
MNFNQLIKNLAEKWSSLSTARKAVIIGGAAAVIILLVFLGQKIFGGKYAPLFSDLSPEEAGAVVEKLDEMKVPYKVGGDGDTILVPEDVLYKTRLQLAGSGVLNTGKGFELFDESKLGATDFERRLNYQRALQEELRRTINYLDEVEDARVHIVLPEDSVFVEEEGTASASVVLALKPFAQLSEEQIKGIIYLVSGSVENLTPEKVNIIDTKGNILSEDIEVGEEGKIGGALSRRQLEMKREFEKNLEDRVEKHLERILGPGRAVVMVSADLNFDQRQVTRIEYGEDGVVRSEKLVERSSVSGGAAAGVPGTPANVGEYQALEPGQSSETETDVTRNYEIDETQETVVYAPGQVQNISTSVAVDGELDAEEIALIEEIVQAAVGYQPERGDQISVVSRTFDRSHIEEAEREMEAAREEQERRERLKRYILIGIAALVVLISGIAAFIIYRRRAREEFEELYPMPVSEAAAVEEEEEKEPEVRIPTEEELQHKRRYESAKEIASKAPDEAAKLIRAWLSEDWGETS